MNAVNTNPACRIKTIETDFREWFYPYRENTVRNLDIFDMQEAFVAGYKVSRADFAELRDRLKAAEDVIKEAKGFRRYSQTIITNWLPLDEALAKYEARNGR